MIESSRSTTGAGEAGSCRDDRARARGGAGRGGARIPAARVVIEDQRDSRARRGEGGRGDEESCSGITTGIACTRRRDSIARTRDVAVTGRACASARRGRGDHRGHDHRRPETRSSVNAVHRSTRPGSWVEAIPSGADSAPSNPIPAVWFNGAGPRLLLTHRAERLGPSMPDWSGFGLGAGFDGWDPPGEWEPDERKQCEDRRSAAQSVDAALLVDLDDLVGRRGGTFASLSAASRSGVGHERDGQPEWAMRATDCPTRDRGSRFLQ